VEAVAWLTRQASLLIGKLGGLAACASLACDAQRDRAGGHCASRSCERGLGDDCRRHAALTESCGDGPGAFNIAIGVDEDAGGAAGARDFGRACDGEFLL
jgi:hypothetical protein